MFDLGTLFMTFFSYYGIPLHKLKSYFRSDTADNNSKCRILSQKCPAAFCAREEETVYLQTK